jgi:hypothetical protein
MTTLELTRKDILNDIEGYKERISKAREKLLGLPMATTVKDRRRIKEKRRILLAEIDHVRGLISIAGEALSQIKENEKYAKEEKKSRWPSE